MKVRNTFIIFTVSGFWHGANWTFIIWGALNAMYFLPLLLTKRNRKNTDVVAENSLLPNVKELFSMGITFFLTVLAWVFFRAESATIALNYLNEVFSLSFFELPRTGELFNFKVFTLLLIAFVLAEWIGRKCQFALQTVAVLRVRVFRWMVYVLLIYLIFMFMPTDETPFIYFQF